MPTTRRSVSRLAADASAGRFVISGEVAPPQSARVGPFFARAEAMSRFARAITVTNNHGGDARLSSLVACGLLARRGIEPIWVCLARDQNRLALESEMIAAEVLNVPNILCLKGDSLGEGSAIREVNDLGLFGLIRMAARLRDAGSPFYVGAALDLNSVSPEQASEMARRRVDAGAEFLLTQPVYEPDRVARFLDVAAPHIPDTALFIGMMPLLSRDATERVPARLRIVVADHILARIADAEDPKGEGLSVFAETLLGLTRLPLVAGINFMPFGFRANIAEEVALAIRDALVASDRRR